MRIYNLLIVDDEPYIVHALADLLASRADLELNVIHAYSAESALLQMKRQHVDILLTDIRMKELSGLELARIVHEAWPACKTLLLTAHNDFDYIYEAYNYDIVSYILKTEPDEHIVYEIKKAIGLIENDLAQFDLLADLGNIHEIRELVQRELFFSLMEDSGSLSETEHAHALKTLGFAAPSGGVYLIIGMVLDGEAPGDDADTDADSDIVTDTEKDSDTDTDTNTDTAPNASAGTPPETDSLNHIAKMHYAVKMAMSHYITSYVPACHCEVKKDRIYWMLQADAGADADADADADKFNIWLSAMLETVQQSCYKSLKMRASFLLSREIPHIGSLAAVYYKGNMLADQFKITQKIEFIFTFDTQNDAIEPGVALSGDAFCSKLNMCVKCRQFQEFFRLMDAYCLDMGKCASVSDICFTGKYYPLALYLLRLLEERQLTQKIDAHFSVQSLFTPYAFDSVQAAADYIKRFSIASIEAMENPKDDFAERTLAVIKEYIDSHIFEDISLQRLADVTNYNLSYLSRLFSTRAGERLNAYIAKRRMEAVRELMRDESLTLNDIALKSGFSTRSYFNRFVKRLTGMTPHDYRKVIETYALKTIINNTNLKA